MTNTAKLIERMLTFDENSIFDGYPGMSCEDEGLIHEAVEEDGVSATKEDGSLRDPLQYLIYLASESAKTPVQFDNARRYIGEYIAVMWACNMEEGQNPVYAERSESEGDYSLI